MNFFQRAFAEAKGSWSWRTYQAAEILVEAFFNQGRWLPARALLQFLLIVQRENRNLSQMLTDLLRSPNCRCCLRRIRDFRNRPRMPLGPIDFPRHMPMMYGDWRTTEGNLSALVAEVPDFPAIWRSLATAARLAERLYRLDRGPAQVRFIRHSLGRRGRSRSNGYALVRRSLGRRGAGFED